MQYTPFPQIIPPKPTLPTPQQVPNQGVPQLPLQGLAGRPNQIAQGTSGIPGLPNIKRPQFNMQPIISKPTPMPEEMAGKTPQQIAFEQGWIKEDPSNPINPFTKLLEGIVGNGDSPGNGMIAPGAGVGGMIGAHNPHKWVQKLAAKYPSVMSYEQWVESTRRQSGGMRSPGNTDWNDYMAYLKSFYNPVKIIPYGPALQ